MYLMSRIYLKELNECLFLEKIPLKPGCWNTPGCNVSRANCRGYGPKLIFDPRVGHDMFW